MQGNPIGHVRTFTPTASGGDAALRMSRALRRLRRQAKRLLRDSSAIAATEFAVIAPLMLMLFFGVVEMSNGITVYRKVSIMAHTLSDLTSQSVSVQDADLANFFAASTGVMTPYPTSPIRQSILELWINSSGQARVQWGKNSDGSTPPAAGTIVSIPAAL